MIKFIRNILGLCNHDYAEVEQLKLKDTSDDSYKGVIYVLRCKKCGKMDKYTVSVFNPY